MSVLVKAHYADATIRVCDDRCYNSNDQTHDCVCGGAFRALGFNRAAHMLPFMATAIAYSLLNEDQALRSLEFHFNQCTSRENDEA